MKLVRIALVLIMALILVGGVFAAGGRQRGDGLTRAFIAGTNGPADTQSMGHFELARRLNAMGGWDVTAFVSSELGSTDDVTEQALQGAPIIAATDPSRLAVYTPEIGILMMPYLFDCYSQIDGLMETALYQEWVISLRQQGIELLTNNSLTGWRNWITNRPIRTPADLNGLRIRTMGNPIAINSVAAMGAIPIAMAQDLAYHAIQTGVVDGGEWQIPTIYSLRLFEVANHISLSRHFLLMVSLVTGTSWFNTLSPEQQTQLRNTTVETFRDNQAIVIEYENRFLDRMRTQHGVVVVENPDRSAFQRASAHLYSCRETSLGADFEFLRTELLRQLGIAR